MTTTDDAHASHPLRPDPRAELLQVARVRFASAGYAGTSLQQIADAAGYSKSSVLYHFASKEALLEAMLAPTLDRLEQILSRAAGAVADREHRELFVEEFVDFLLVYRLEVHLFINQAQSLADVPIIDRASAIIERLSDAVVQNLGTAVDRVRFSVALGGAAYTLVAGEMFGQLNDDDQALRDALTTVLAQLLAITEYNQR